MRDVRGWQGWEKHVNDSLGLSATAGSGNQWYEKGDGIDKSDSEWAFQVDAKFTDKKSRSVSVKEFGSLAMDAAMQGKRFAMPIRLWPAAALTPADLVVITFQDFVALVEAAKAKEEDDRGPAIA